MAGSSSSAAGSLLPVIRHHVFLNFRGEDTRDNFIRHIYEQLQRKKIETYIDYRLSRGQEISPALHRAIEESMIYVVVFSENYASSTWCLDELTKILDCKKRYGRVVIPVFYKVDPSIVRNQRETYAEAFVKHEHRFQDKFDKVHGWKAALTEAAGLSGWDSQVTRPEATLVAEIVKDILEKLDSSSISDHQGIVGIENHITRIQSLMNLESPDIRIIGIWGLGGIGKTTIARKIYHKLAPHFGSSSLVLNVQEEIQRHGIHHSRSKYISELLGKEKSFSNERLKQKKVLLILDDVNDSGQLKDLIGGRGDFGQGSRIILTSRGMQVLKNAEADEIYEVKEMNFQNSLNLFSIHAFHQNHPRETYMDLSIKVLHYAKGIPLALQSLGSLLYDRTKEAWESELQKLEKLPDPKIFSVLKLSYDGLDEEQKNIFLDIACFYRGHEEIIVAQKLESCGFSATIGMDVLKDKCLISTLEGKIEMHDLIQEMGQEIVRQECCHNPGKCSRLWKVEQIHQVLKDNKGTDAVQCMFLDTRKVNEVKLHSKTFEKMENLRMLHFESDAPWIESNVVQLASSLESLPDGLKILRWDGFPQRSLPPNYWPQNLVRLEMRHSNLEQLWEPDQELPKLKRLDLSYSRKLIRIPDLYLLPDIEEILLIGCESLTEVYSSGFLNKLNCLCLNLCVELRSLTIPSNILWRSSGLILVYGCDKLETFSISNRTEVVQLSGCSHHDTFPTGKGWYYQEYPGWVNYRVDGTGGLCRARPSRAMHTFDPVVNIHRHEVEEKEEKEFYLLYPTMWSEGVSPTLSIPNELCWLDLSYCGSLTSLSFEFDLSKLKFLKKLLLDGCLEFKIFPEIEDTMENLAVLKLDATAIQALPSSLCRLVALEELSLHYCERLETIPSSIGDLSKLCKLGLTKCESLETFPSSIFKLKLTKLDLYGCSKLRTFPEILELHKRLLTLT
ncbi:hypothetical protein AAZX31_01G031700 [Glycine max]|uniref:TIR domain-containing protein n=2 Tax=Glycine subgen. Soja TaxID=1462606 RepID=K7K1J3_SOYBN|nr:hypothetical protein GYH30_000340 [Glycine max]KAH1264380.1 TMV resistance protein N [Glycine max]KRH74632.1 hypothetical protein GLYMA_01G032900v4 [Glycine max]RZC28278.1 TMV resistance protein N [Glycine soja]